MNEHQSSEDVSKKESHYFTPQEGDWTEQRFCERCGKYMTDDVHIRFESWQPAKKAQSDE